MHDRKVLFSVGAQSFAGAGKMIDGRDPLAATAAARLEEIRYTESRITARQHVASVLTFLILRELVFFNTRRIIFRINLQPLLPTSP
jgi:hypothetical protein